MNYAAGRERSVTVDRSASPEQTTEADVTAVIGTHLVFALGAIVKPYGDDQLEVTMADGSVFQINVNRVR